MQIVNRMPQYCGGCSVHRGDNISTVLGYLQYCGSSFSTVEVFSTVEDTFSTVGDTFSTVRDSFTTVEVVRCSGG